MCIGSLIILFLFFNGKQIYLVHCIDLQAKPEAWDKLPAFGDILLLFLTLEKILDGVIFTGGSFFRFGWKKNNVFQKKIWTIEFRL